MACVKNWEPASPDWWFFKCVESQPHCDAKIVQGDICTGVGADPNATGTVLPCCQQFSTCSRNWTDGVTSTKCVESEFDCQSKCGLDASPGRAVRWSCLPACLPPPNETELTFPARARHVGGDSQAERSTRTRTALRCSTTPPSSPGRQGQDALPACHHDPSAFSSQYGECFARMNWLTVNWDRGDSKEFYANAGVDGSWCSAQIFLSNYETFCPRCACVDGAVAAPGVVVPPDSQYRSCYNSASSFVTATLATSDRPCASGQSCKMRAGSSVAYCLEPACGDLSLSSIYDKRVFHRDDPGHACCARYGASACAPWQRCIMWNAPGVGLKSRCENEDVLLDVMVAMSAASAAGNASACAAAALRANDTSLEAGSGTCWLAAGVRAAAAAVLAVQDFNRNGTAGRACRRLLIARMHDTGSSVLQTGRLALAAAADESLALVGPGDAVSQGVVATLGGGEGIASLALGEVPPSFASRRDYPFLYAVAHDPALAARAVCSLWSSRHLSRATVLLGPGSFLAATSVEVLQACRATGVDVRLANVDFSAPAEAARSAAALDAVYKSGANVFLVLADRAAGARELLAMIRAAVLAGILRAGSTWTFGDRAVAQAAADAAARDAELAAALDGSLVLDVAPRVAQSFARRWAAVNASHLAAALAAAGGPALGAELGAALSGDVDPAAAYMYDAVTAAGLAACDALGAEPYLDSAGRAAQRGALRAALPRVSFDGATGRIAFAQGSGLRADAPRVRLLNLVLPPQAEAGGGRRLGAAALEAVELGEFDSAAEAFALAREPVFNGGLLAVPGDQVAVRDPDELRVAILQPMGSEAGNAWLGPGWQVSTAMALLAVEHFNARRDELAPQLGALVCNKRMRVTLRDSGDSVRRAVEGVFDVAGSHDVLIGPATDAMVDATSAISGLYRVPMAGFSATAARAAAAGAQSAASAYFRTAPADDLIAGAICALWRRLGFAYAALLYPETSPGLAYRSALSAACAGAGLHVESFPYDPLAGGPEAAAALAQRLAASQINVVLFMWSEAGGNEATLASVLLAAFARGLLGDGTSWVLSDASAWQAAQRHAGLQPWQDVLAALAGSLVVRPVAGSPTNPRLASLLARFPQLVAGLGASFAQQLAAQGLPALDFSALPAAAVAEALETHPGLYEFDAIVAVGLAACRVAPQAPLPVAQSEYPELILAAATALDVLGVSGTGSVRFSNNGDRAADTVVYALYNAVREPGQLARAGIFDSSSGSWNVTGALCFNGLAANTPDAIRPLFEDRQLQGAQVKSIAWALFGTDMAITLACLLFTVACRAHPVIKASQMRLTCLVCFGSVVTSTTIALITTEDGDAASGATGGMADAACVAAAWTYCIGFVISYATLALKQYRIIMLFSGILSEKERRKLTDEWLVRWVSLHVAVDAALCAVWTATDAPRFQRIVTATDQYGNPTVSHGTCASNNINVFAALVFAHHLALLVMGAYYSYRSLALNIHGAFSEGKQVRMAVVSALQMFMLSIPVMMLSSSTDATLFVRTMVIFLMDAGTMLLIFTPKVMMLVHGVTNDGAIGAAIISKSVGAHSAAQRSSKGGSNEARLQSQAQARTQATMSIKRSSVDGGFQTVDAPSKGSSVARSSAHGSNQVVPEPRPSDEPEQQNGQDQQ